MELWIRNQNRETLELTTYLQIIYLDELDSENKWVIEGGSYLGYYKTKERALEVLDEIQNILKPQKIIKTIDNTVKIENAIHIVNPTYETITQFDTYVYEMPEE